MGQRGEAARTAERARDRAKDRLKQQAKERQAAMIRAEAEETERIRSQQSELRAACMARRPEWFGEAA